MTPHWARQHQACDVGEPRSGRHVCPPFLRLNELVSNYEDREKLTLTMPERWRAGSCTLVHKTKLEEPSASRPDADMLMD